MIHPLGNQGMVALFGDVACQEARREQRDHHREQYPALGGPAGHSPEGVGERGGQDRDSQQFEKIREGRRILEGVRSVDVEEAAPVGAEVLDGLESGDRAHRDDLLGEQGLLRLRLLLLVKNGLAVGVGQRLVISSRLHDRDVRVRGEVHGYALPDEQRGADHRKWQQHPERRAGDIHPEVTEQGRALPGQAPDERDADGETGRSGQEILGRQTEDLAQIAHRGLAAVGLPGGRGREADRRVHREVGSERSRAVRRVERVEERLHS
jgi:hypothetical protein